MEEDPRWRMGNYQKIVRADISKGPDAFDLFSLSLVSAYLRALSNELSQLQKNFSDNLYDYVSSHYLLFKYSIEAWMKPKVTLNRKDFAPRYISKSVVHELEENNFSWAEYTSVYNERIVRDVVFGLGETGEEKFTLLFAIDEDAQKYYDRNSYYQDVVREMFAVILHELCEKYDKPNRQEEVIFSPEYKMVELNPEAIKKRMDELLVEYNRLKEMLEKFSEDETGEEDMVGDENEGSDEDYVEEDEWDATYDDVFNTEINPQKVFEKLEYMDDPRVTEDYPRFFVFFKVLLYIGWIKNQQNNFLKWANCHWERGWEKTHCFKFSNNIQKEIRDAHISKWGDATLPDISKAYRAFAIDVLSKFAEKVNGGKIIDIADFYNDGVTKRINDGKKLEYPF